MAVCDETNQVKIFNSFDKFKEFSEEMRYSWTYYTIGGVEEVRDVDLFLY